MQQAYSLRDWTAAPAIAEMVRDILSDAGLELKEKPDFDPIHKRPLRFTELDQRKAG